MDRTAPSRAALPLSNEQCLSRDARASQLVHVDFKHIKMAVGHSHKALMQSSSGSENEDDVPPSMHESLREEVASSNDDESSSDGGSKRPLRDDALPGYSVKDASNDVEEDEELLLDKSASDQRGQKLKNGGRKTRKSRGHTRNAASSNMTGEELKLKLEQSNLRKRRRRSSAAKSERVSTCNMTIVK